MNLQKTAWWKWKTSPLVPVLEPIKKYLKSAVTGMKLNFVFYLTIGNLEYHIWLVK